MHEWSNSIGIEKAEVLRELAEKLKKNELTVSDCAKGSRIVTIFKKYGLKEEDEAAVLYISSHPESSPKYVKSPIS